MRKILCAAALVLLLPVPAARAQVFGTVQKEPDDFSSPQYAYFEVKFGPYSPDIDSEFGSRAAPFSDLFGSGTDLMVKIELDLELWSPFGTLAIGGAIGHYGTSASAFVDTSTDGKTPSSTSSRSAGETSIDLMPLALLLVYRADFTATRFDVPLVPYIKLGLNYTFWWITKGDGSAATFEGTDASGGSIGWQLNAGVALLLDMFEPKAAKTLDVELGINHTYLFFEFVHVQADGFGSDTALVVGDTTWDAGIAFEF